MKDTRDRESKAEVIPAEAGLSPMGERRMNNMLINLYLKFHDLQNGEQGQDLIEYALMIALISLVCISGINGMASAVNSVFTNISTSLA